ncbi:hypothetical protein [Cutibacterium acnes]|uniref:hypothetical protein n=1 Tax=Cutibacterium acnes TaxID=1747 RepID=UPI001F25C34A|nr:hypothetical protein [Cutibacterium acnes]
MPGFHGRAVRGDEFGVVTMLIGVDDISSISDQVNELAQRVLVGVRSGVETSRQLAGTEVVRGLTLS